MNHFQLATEGRTAYGKLHGTETTGRICEFGERVMWCVAVKPRAKMDVKWRCGWFLGRSTYSDQNLFALADGTVTRARAMARLIPAHRWDTELLQVLTATPGDEQPPSLDHLEAEPTPHENAAAEHPDDEHVSK